MPSQLERPDHTSDTAGTVPEGTTGLVGVGQSQDSGTLRITVNAAIQRPSNQPFGHAAIDVTAENTGIAVTLVGQMGAWYATDVEGRRYQAGPAGGSDVTPAFPVSNAELQPGEKVRGWIVFDANDVRVNELHAIFDGGASTLTWDLGR